MEGAGVNGDMNTGKDLVRLVIEGRNRRLVVPGKERWSAGLSTCAGWAIFLYPS